MLSAGCQLGDRYVTSRLLGRGGMGEVWAARQLHDPRPVAIKVLLERTSRRQDIVRRFEREAQAAARIQSRHVCALLDTGTGPDGSLFLVFELLEGESLAERLRRELFLPFYEIARIMCDVLRGVTDAHDASVLHRDLKPGNIFLTRDQHGAERAVVLDFGVSKLVHQAYDRDEPSLTAYDGTVGSFAYMAPEQVRGAARVDARADVYGVAAVAFRALTGRLPFLAPSARMVASLKLDNDAPSLAEATEMQWPAAIEQFFARALARNPDDRFASAPEALASWCQVIDRFDQAVLNASSRL